MTKPEFKSLSGKEQWDVLVAMRGPDCYLGETIKWFSTSVLRHAMREVIRVGGTINTDLKLVVIPYGAAPMRDAWGFNWEHFAQHVREAASILGIPQLNLPTDAWMKAVETDHLIPVGEALLKIARHAGKDPIKVEELARHVKFLGGKGEIYAPPEPAPPMQGKVYFTATQFATQLKETP